ncbi:MAG TPA: hypothetical protein VJI46_04725 [Candidatus Nanoarchaeia archaeon]|nr:hypothetical protein [Candidatus Nanoarchaeia archaeon]
MAYGTNKPWENPFASYHATFHSDETSHEYHAAEKYHSGSSELYNVGERKEEEEKESTEEDIEKEAKKEDEAEEKKETQAEHFDIPKKEKPASIEDAIEKAISNEKGAQ